MLICHASTEAGVKAQPKLWQASAEALLSPFSPITTQIWLRDRTLAPVRGFRTLNLAVNRSLPPVQKWWSEFAECR
jgi:hypothetical protein